MTLYRIRGNFRGFHRLPGHLRKFHPRRFHFRLRIKVIIKWPSMHTSSYVLRTCTVQNVSICKGNRLLCYCCQLKYIEILPNTICTLISFPFADLVNNDRSLMDLDFRLKAVEDSQQYILEQISHLQYSVSMLPPFTPLFMPPPPPSGKFSSKMTTSVVAPTTPGKSQPLTSDSTQSPLPLNKVCVHSLQSSDINKDELISVEKVIAKYLKLKPECKAGKLACKIAKEAVFGANVMKRCTPVGNTEFPGLPEKELQQLKKSDVHTISTVLEQQS